MFSRIKNSVIASVAVSLALFAPAVFAQAAATGVDFATAAADMKTQALAALSVIGLAVLAVAAAIAAFRKGKSIIK